PGPGGPARLAGAGPAPASSRWRLPRRQSAHQQERSGRTEAQQGTEGQTGGGWQDSPREDAEGARGISGSQARGDSREVRRPPEGNERDPQQGGQPEQRPEKASGRDHAPAERPLPWPRCSQFGGRSEAAQADRRSEGRHQDDREGDPGQDQGGNQGPG